MLKHGIDQLRIRRTPLSVLGTSGCPSWAQALVSPRMSLNKFPSPYAILKNIIIRGKYEASVRHPKIHAILYTASTVTAWTCPTKMVFLPFRLQFLSVASFATLSKHYSVWLMVPVLCNSSHISQKGGLAVLCPVAVLGTLGNVPKTDPPKTDIVYPTIYNWNGWLIDHNIFSMQLMLFG